MKASTLSFVDLVREDWSRAVMIAAHHHPDTRDELLLALRSPDANVRRAAVAALNEANDAAAHDAVIELASDPDEEVRSEVVEYVEEFPRLSDAPAMFRELRECRHLYLASSALCKLFPGKGPLLDDEDFDAPLSRAIIHWRTVLSGAGIAV